MSEERGLPAIYIDGETKTGKGAAGLAISESLRAAGRNVYYDVAGDFYRRFVAIVRQDMQLDETAPLPTGPELEQTAAAVYESRKPFSPDPELGDLQRPAISESVAVLTQLALVQQAGIEWWLESVRSAVSSGADVIVLDGRNPREKVAKATAAEGPKVETVLDLYMTCGVEEAARRVLLSRGVTAPSADELQAQTDAVEQRRQQDRNRTESPFTAPTASVIFMPGIGSAEAAVAHSWQPQNGHELPLSIMLDNTHLAKPDMLTAVSDLALAALNRENKATA
jgi:cytidylate kinase